MPKAPMSMLDSKHGGKTPFGSAFVPWFAALSCLLFCLNSELLQALQLHVSPAEGRVSLALNLCLCHLGGLVFAPKFFRWSPLGTVSGPSPVTMSLLFALLLMGTFYAWLWSTTLVPVGLTNAVFQTSVALVYVASVLVFGEAVTQISTLGVAFALVGSMLASGVGLSGISGVDAKGVCVGFLASVGYMVYQVLLRHVYGHLSHDGRFLAHFGAWVSIWHVLAVFPLLVLAHIFGFEALEFPHGKIAIAGTLASAVIASIVNALNLCIVMWGTPMDLPCASALSIPLAVCLDAMLHHTLPGRVQILGHLMVVLSVMLITNMHVVSWQVFKRRIKWTPGGSTNVIGRTDDTTQGAI